MAHTIRDKKKLLNRVNRITGQVAALKRALEEEQECGAILHLIAASHGAMRSLMAEVLEEHVRAHAFAGAAPGSKAAAEAEEVIDIVRAYLK
jgi:FrmR/RcnR family transcriptional regulator, repressor of frmRAB operon